MTTAGHVMNTIAHFSDGIQEPSINTDVDALKADPLLRPLVETVSTDIMYAPHGLAVLSYPTPEAIGLQ